MAWNPDQYDKFKHERSAPVLDLLSLVKIRPKLRVIDLGCGTGEHTLHLADLLPQSIVIGIDISDEMLSKSLQYKRLGVTFENQSFEEIVGEYDLIFSNAALQWSPNHEKLFSNIWNHLAPGGQLLVQMPSNQDHFSHEIAFRLATIDFVNHFPVNANNPTNRLGWMLTVDAYAKLLFALGGVDITAILKVYPHILENSDAIVEWTKGTLLVPYLEQLSPALGKQFLELYRGELRKKFPECPVFYGFKRILLSCLKEK